VVPIQRFILALDQGTTGSAALVFDDKGWVIASSDQEIRQSYPQPGWVEHDPIEIYETTVSVGRKALDLAGARADEVAAIGIANQRETAVIWERDSGRPIYPAVVWQSRASADICDRLRSDGLESLFCERTGQLLDA
jgi:glycerol kinase